MTRLHVLGSGHAMVTNCFNSCFILEDCDDTLLIDCGGGNEILHRIFDSGVSLDSIHQIFISHNHCDHVLGLFWVIRAISVEILKKTYVGDLAIFCDSDTEEFLRVGCSAMFGAAINKLIDERIIFHKIDLESPKIGLSFHPYVTGSRVLQHGFVCILSNGKKLVFSGDELIEESLIKEARDTDYLICETFGDDAHAKENFKSTIEESAIICSKTKAKTIIFTHMDDFDLENRKTRITEEASKYCRASIIVPYDGEIIELK